MAMNHKPNRHRKRIKVPAPRWFNDFPTSSTQQIRQSSKESTGSSDTDSSSEDESIQAPSSGPPEPSDKVQQAKETEAGAEISALVNYVQPVHFSSFENSESELIDHYLRPASTVPDKRPQKPREFLMKGVH